MNKLNKVGNQMLDYKAELNKDYPELVINSLLSMVDNLAQDGAIDVDIHYAVKEDTVTKESLRELLLGKTTFLKTHEELFAEYEEIRGQINHILGINGEDDNEIIKTVSSVTNEKIAITKEFILTEEFVKDYFYIDSDKDYEILMKRKGFVEKFAILRLDKILRDFKVQNEIYSELYEIMNSNVFFEAERNVYGIHLLFNIPIDNLEDSEKLFEIVNEIKDTIDKANAYFDSRMTI